MLEKIHAWLGQRLQKQRDRQQIQHNLETFGANGYSAKTFQGVPIALEWHPDGSVTLCKEFVEDLLRSDNLVYIKAQLTPPAPGMVYFLNPDWERFAHAGVDRGSDTSRLIKNGRHVEMYPRRSGKLSDPIQGIPSSPVITAEHLAKLQGDQRTKFIK